MSVGELARILKADPLAVYAALVTLALISVCGLLIQSYRSRIRTAEVHAYDLAKMMELQSRTLETLGRACAVLELPAVSKLLHGNARWPRGADD